MIKRPLCFLVLLLPFAAGGSGRNILFILADDLSSQDLGCYGNELFATPHLDKLAAEGIRFTEAYSPAPICSASRASILTGKSTARLGFEFVTKDSATFQPLNERLRAPRYTLDLPLSEVTMAENLASAGYRTAFFGKWHLNQHYRRYLGWSPTHGPPKQGFAVTGEEFGSHPYSYWKDKTKRTFLDLPSGEYPVDALTGLAKEFLRSDHDKPFFLMVSHFFVHTPVHTRMRWLYEKTLATIPLDHPRRDALARYGAMVTTLDFQVGELLAVLDEEGLKDSTLVVFTADNGGHPEFAGNAPFRGSKWNLYEGGIRVPLVVRWPGRIKPGMVSKEPVIGYDLLPTFADIAGSEPPPNLDGRSLVPIFENPESAGKSRELLWHFPYYHPETRFKEAPSAIGVDDGYTSQTRPQSALRSGPWKLIHFFEDDRDELYHLEKDPAEQDDRSGVDPVMAERLRGQLDEALGEAKARFPVPNPAAP